MKLTEFKEIVDALSRFATSRETARGPEAFIGVQSGSGLLKLISGDGAAGMVVTIGPSVGYFSYVVSARPLIQASKLLKGKMEIEISATPEALTISTDSGGRVVLRPTGDLTDTGFAKKPKDVRATVHLKDGQFLQVSKLFRAISEEVQVPSVQIIGDKGYMTAVSGGLNAQYACLAVAGDGPSDYTVSGYRSFWEALRTMEEAGTLELCEDGLRAQSGRYECYSGSYRVSKWDERTKVAELPRHPMAWPVMQFNDAKSTAAFTLPKKDLQNAAKGQAPLDSYARITLEVLNGIVNVRAFGEEEGMTVPCETSGGGLRAVSATLLNEILTAVDAKEVTIRWGTSPALRIEPSGYDDFTILLGPVALS